MQPIFPVMFLAFLSMPAAAIDAWQLLRDEVCNKSDLTPQRATQISYFQFQREDGFECASKAIKVLTDELSKDPSSKIHSSRILWKLFEATVSDSARDTAFRSITSAIRLSDGHPLRGEARLAQARLSIIRGRAESDFYPQLDGLLTDLNLTEDSKAKSRIYADGSTGLREALRWLFSARGRARAAQAAGQPLELRLRSLGYWSHEMARLGSFEPELLQFALADAWKNGARLIVPGDISEPSGGNALPGISGRLKYSLCASGQCLEQTNIAVAGVNDQLVEKSESLDITNALASMMYSIGSNPVVQNTCPGEGKACTNEGGEETGRHYWISVNSAVTGGAAWKDAFWKKVKGTNDRYSEVSYSFTGTVNLPACTDPSACPVMMYARASLAGYGNDTGAVRSLKIRRPDGAITSLANHDLIAIDRSSGAHDLILELNFGHGERGSSSSGNSSLATVTLISASKLSKTFVNGAKAVMEKESASLGRYLPLLLVSRALLLRPEVYANAPAYMGLGEALGQYSDSTASDRWERVYVPLYILNLLKEEVGAELLADERRGMDLTARVLSRNAKRNFPQAIDQEIALLTAIQPAISVTLIDSAIVAIQKDKPLDDSIGPFVESIIATNPNDRVSEGSIAKAQELINRARQHDNLLDAVLLLYEARERLLMTSNRIGLRLEILSVERTGYPLP